MSEPINRWKGFILGALGGVAGVLAMGKYWQLARAVTGEDPRQASKGAEWGQSALDEISLVGPHHQPDESSTAAVGRLLYQQVTGEAPAEETTTLLSYGVHWLFSLGFAAGYGAWRGQHAGADLRGGLLMGSALWLVGDELLMPLAGLTDGPTAYPPALHLHGWAAHLAYGAASAVAAQALHRLL